MATIPRVPAPPIDDKAPNALFLQYMVGEIVYLHSCVDESKDMIREVLAWQKNVDETTLAETVKEKERTRLEALEKAVAARRLSYLRQTWTIFTKITNNGVVVAGVIALTTLLYKILG